MSDKPDPEDIDFTEAEDDFPPEDDDNEILSAFLEKPPEEEEEEEKPAEEEEKTEKEEKTEDVQDTEEEKSDAEEEVPKEEEKREEIDEIEVDDDGVWKIPEEASVRLKVNKQEKVLAFKEVVDLAQKADASDEKFQRAAAQTKQALAVIQKAKENPLDVCYNLLVKEFGHEKAYAHVLDAATRLVGKELEYQKLPPEERQKRESDTILAQKDYEINRLRQEKEKNVREQRGQILAREIINECVRQGMAASVDDLMENHGDAVLDIVNIFDVRQNAGREITPAQAVSEYLKTSTARFETRLKALSDDELRKIGLSRAAKEQTSSATLRKVRPRRASTDPAKPRAPRKREEKMPYFKNVREAQEWARKHK